MHEPEDFGGWWHLIAADSLCKTIRKKPLDFFIPGPQVSIETAHLTFEVDEKLQDVSVAPKPTADEPGGFVA